MSKTKFSLLFALNLFVLLGLRTCDPGTPIGFPVVAAVYTPPHMEPAYNILSAAKPLPVEIGSEFKIFGQGVAINAAFAALLFFVLLRLTSSQKWKSALPVRVGGYTSLGYLIYGNIVNLLIALFNARGIFDQIGEILTVPWFFFLVLWSRLIHFKDFVILHPTLLRYYPQDDDLTFRVIIPLALLTVFGLGMLVAKITLKIKQKKTQPLNS